MRRSATPMPLTPRAPAWVAVVLIGAAGCTICPDPFDYSGPVPNGSAPQNDFRARSNGIAPLGGVPRPWPPVVQATPRDDETTTVSAVAATVPSHDDAADESPAEPAVQPAAAEAGTAPSHDESLPAVTAPMLEDILPPGPPPRPEMAAPLRETPGWRPRD